MILKHVTFRNLKCSLFYSLSTFLGLLVLISGLLFTNVGNQVIISIIKPIEPRLTIDLEEGSFFFSPHYNEISWKDSSLINLEIKDVGYVFDWSCLPASLCIESLESNSTSIILFNNTTETTMVEDGQGEPFRLNLPIPLTIQKANLQNTYFEMKKVVVVDLKSIDLTANGHGANIFTTSTAQGLTVTLPKAKKIKANTEKKATNKTISFPAILSDDSLVDVVLPLDLTISKFVLTDFLLEQGTTPLFALNKIETGLTFKKSLVKVSHLKLDLDEIDLDLSGQINLVNRYPLNINANGKLKNIKQLEPAGLLNGVSYKLLGEGDLSTLKTNLTLLDSRESPALKINAETKIDLYSDNLAHKLKLTWLNLRWPLQGKSQFSSQKGNISSEGLLNKYKINAAADYNVLEIPTGKILLNSKGDLNEVELNNLLIKTLNGEIKLKGLLNWEDNIEWNGLLNIKEIDLVQITKEYEGVFSGEVEQSVQIDLSDEKETHWEFDFPSLDIDGSFMKNPFVMSGELSGSDSAGIKVSELKIDNVTNKFVINGLVAEQNDLKINLLINNFSQVLKGGSGKVSGEVLIKGPQNKLNIKTKLEASDLSYENNKIKALTLVSDFILKDKPIINSEVVATKLFVSGVDVDSINLKIQHTEKKSKKIIKHVINLDVKSKLVTTDLVFNVEQTQNKILSSLYSASFVLPKQSATLDQQFQIALEKNNNISLSKHCWSTFNKKKIKSGSICVDEFNVGESGDVEININNYLLASLNPLLPDKFKLGGSVSSKAKAHWKKNKHPIFDVNVNSKDMLVIANDSKGQNNNVIYPVETFFVEIKGAKEIDLSVSVLSDDLIDAKINANVSPYKKKPLIKGNVIVDMPNLSPFAALVKQVEALTGSLNADFNLSGDLKNPTVKGEINLKDGKVISAFIPLHIQDFNANVIIDGTEAKLNGKFSTGDGKSYQASNSKVKKNLFTKSVSFIDKSVKKTIPGKGTKKILKIETAEIDPGQAIMKGFFNWKTNFKGQLAFEANKMEIYKYGSIDFLISPKLKLIIDKEIDLSGDVYVNEGSVIIKDLPEGAVVVSKDVVVIDIEQEAASTILPVKINLKLDLGKDLKIDALGLKSHVRGQLEISKRKASDLQLNGQLRLLSGSYRALGQHLVLRKSRINFIGPADSPYISIEAIRDPEKVEDGVVAGVRVTGTPDSLELAIFSEPSMSQENALSYITTGKSVENSSGSSNSQIASLLVDLGGSRSSETLKNFGDSVGISEVSLASQGFGDEQSIGVSGYIAPDVQLSYGVGIFDDFTIVAIRYELFKNFYLEASNGLYQAVDAYYNFDWD